MKPKTLQLLAWITTATIVVLAFVAWGQGVRWELTNLSTYKLFPLFGLLAFSLIWDHYVMSALRQLFQIAIGNGSATFLTVTRNLAVGAWVIGFTLAGSRLGRGIDVSWVSTAVKSPNCAPQ